MRVWRWAACLAALAFVAGCMPLGSLHPLYKADDDPYFVPSLLGTWRAADEREHETWVFRQGEDEGTYALTIASPYEVSYNEDGSLRSVSSEMTVSNYTVRLVKLNDLVFLDLYPNPRLGKTPDKPDDWATVDMVRLHTVQRAWIDHDRLRVTTLSTDWWDEQEGKGKVPLRVEEIEGAPLQGQSPSIIISSTDDLRAFYTRAAADPKAFSDPEVLVRIEPAPALPARTR